MVVVCLARKVLVLHIVRRVPLQQASAPTVLQPMVLIQQLALALFAQAQHSALERFRAQLAPVELVAVYARLVR